MSVVCLHCWVISNSRGRYFYQEAGAGESAGPHQGLLTTF